MATSTASSTQHLDPLLGKTVGERYVIERLIGRGGVGLVYLADDTHAPAERKVVVKVLSPHWAQDRDAVARFDREALRMAELDHPNVVKMFDHGHFEGRAFIVMEFIRGEPLRRYLNRRKRMPLEEFLPVAMQILLGAGYVHERGIMMRDIKPPNIMLCEHAGKANHVKMLDFGLAKLIEEDDEEITKAHVIGTAAYMSPEQIKGEKIDVRVDVYALGVLFFLMLTGEQPIPGDNDAAVLVNHVHGVPKSLAERLPKGHRIPPGVIALIESCLAKSPDDRPHDAGHMAKQLIELVAAPLLEQPTATLKTRAAAETYWATRLNTGPAATAALESDTNDSAEWTRPLLRRAAKTGEAPLKLAEAEIASLHQKLASEPLGRPPTRPPGPRPTPKPRSPTGSGLISRPKPPPLPPPPSRARTTTPLTSRPGSATIRVTAADAKEAVAKLEEELQAEREDAPLPAAVPVRTLVPTSAPGDAPASAPGHAPTSAPGHAQTSAPGHAPTSAPGHAPTSAPVPKPAAASVSGPSLDAAESASDAAKTGRRTSVPPLSAAELDPDASESSDLMQIALDDDDDEDDGDEGHDGRPSEAFSPTVPSDPMVTDALGVMAPMAMVAPPRTPDGMRLGAIVAVAGLFALALGGLTAFLVLGDHGEPAAPPAAAVVEAAAEPSPSPTPTPAPTVAEALPAATVGTVEVRALEGARVEIDGEDRGEAPVHVELPLGEHRVRVTAAGHHPWQTTIEVSPGANAAVKAELAPAEADPGVVIPEPVVHDDPKRPKPSGSKPSTSKPKVDPKPEATADPEPKPAAKPKPKPKGDVFMDPSKGKDDGIFMPVGGK